jgi:uncharacterized protein
VVKISLGASDGTGIRAALKMLCPQGLRVRVPPRPPTTESLPFFWETFVFYRKYLCNYLGGLERRCYYLLVLKVFIIHGFEGSPNGGWRPWLMAELGKKDVYACALPMPKPNQPIRKEWVAEIAKNINQNKEDNIYLVGHSLGVPAILHYLQNSDARPISGSVLVSGPFVKVSVNHKADPSWDSRTLSIMLKKAEILDNFIGDSFNFEKIKSKCKRFHVIHGDNDPLVPLDDAKNYS